MGKRESIRHYNWLVAHAKAIQALIGKPSGHDSRLSAILEHSPDLSDNGFNNPPKVINIKDFPELATSVVVDSVEVSYQKLLKRKYHDWTTRTNKRRMKVEFLSGLPNYMKSYGG